MNKKELIKEIDKINAFAIYGKTTTKEQAFAVGTAVGKALDLAKRLDEPEKVKIPQFAADWIERCRANDFNLQHAMDSARVPANASEFIFKAPDIFARAWLDGYEVEQEKLYEVVLPGTSNYYDHPQKLCQAEEGNYFFCGEASKFKHSFTEDEIREDFEWAWQAGFAKEVENEG